MVWPYNESGISLPFYLFSMTSSVGYYLDQSNFDLLAITGPDAEKFLQGQLTCDVAALKESDTCPGAVCTNKGRVLATFLLCRLGGTFIMILTRGLAEPAQAHLQKYLPFYKCSLQKADGALIAVVSPKAKSILHELHLQMPAPGVVLPIEQGWAIVPDFTKTRVLLYLKEGQSNGYQEKLSRQLAPAALPVWFLGDMDAGIFPFSAEDSGLYTPQEIHLDRAEFVSFSKGCYTGQEIIARMHYKSKPKKQLFRLEFKPCRENYRHETIKLFDSNGMEIGSTLKVLPVKPDTCQGLAALPITIDYSEVRTAVGDTVSITSFQPEKCKPVCTSP